MSEKISVQAQIVAKESPDFTKVQHKATAGLTEAEILLRNTIGEIKETSERSGEGDKGRA
jgi:hypothetical protein